MKNLFIIVSFGALTACDTGTPNYWTLPKERVAVADMVFDVRHDWHTAEAVRVNKMYLPKRGVVRTHAIDAIERVTGCSVVSGSVKGDQAVVQVALTC